MGPPEPTRCQPPKNPGIRTQFLDPAGWTAAAQLHSRSTTLPRRVSAGPTATRSLQLERGRRGAAGRSPALIRVRLVRTSATVPPVSRRLDLQAQNRAGLLVLCNPNESI